MWVGLLKKELKEKKQILFHLRIWSLINVKILYVHSRVMFLTQISSQLDCFPQFSTFVLCKHQVLLATEPPL